MNLLKWRAATGETGFETTPAGDMHIDEQEYFDHCTLMVAMCKSGVELAFECMVEVGMTPESAYYESLHEAPLIANLIASKLRVGWGWWRRGKEAISFYATNVSTTIKD